MVTIATVGKQHLNALSPNPSPACGRGEQNLPKDAGRGECLRLTNHSVFRPTIFAGTDSVSAAPTTMHAASRYMPESVLCVRSLSQPTA